MSNGISESVVQGCSLDWLRDLSYEVLDGLTIAPGEEAAERSDEQSIHFTRFQTRVAAFNPKIPVEGWQEALPNVRLISPPTLIENNRAFIRL